MHCFRFRFEKPPPHPAWRGGGGDFPACYCILYTSPVQNVHNESLEIVTFRVYFEFGFATVHFPVLSNETLSLPPPPTQKHCGEYPHPTQKKIFHCREYPSQPKLNLPCGEYPPRTQKKTSTMVSMSISPTSKNYFWECVAPIEKLLYSAGSVHCPCTVQCPVSNP